MVGRWVLAPPTEVRILAPEPSFAKASEQQPFLGFFGRSPLAVNRVKRGFVLFGEQVFISKQWLGQGWLKKTTEILSIWMGSGA